MNIYGPCYDRLHMPKVSLLISFTYIYYASSLQLCIGFMLMYLSLCACVYSSPSWIPLIIRPCVATETVWKLKHLAEVIARHCMRGPNCRCLCTVQLRWVKVKVGASSFAIQINSRGQLKSPGNRMKFYLNLPTLKL